MLQSNMDRATCARCDTPRLLLPHACSSTRSLMRPCTCTEIIESQVNVENRIVFFMLGLTAVLTTVMTVVRLSDEARSPRCRSRHRCVHKPLSYTASFAVTFEPTWVSAWSWCAETAALRDSCGSLNSHHHILPRRMCNSRSTQYATMPSPVHFCPSCVFPCC